MDFDLAAKRLDRDHSRLKREAAERKGAGPRGGGGGGGRSGGIVELSARARREAEELQRQARRKAEERQAKLRERDHQLEFVRQRERSLKVRGLVASSSSSSPSSSAGAFLPTSIHGDGDKLALPPSVLEHLSTTMTENASPWTFRVGVLNPDYSFPASPLVQSMRPPSLDGAMDDDDDDDDLDEDDDNNETIRNAQSAAAYLDELSHKYLAYTHGTVVEFTQEEGHVGLPRAIASALITQIGKKNVPAKVKRTVDPATATAAAATDNIPTEMDVDRGASGGDADEERTAGHLAWGAFDIPDMPVEVSLVELPKGKACTLAPTPQAIAKGFYNLADVKLVLEQSLIRTRATLTVGDLVQTWNRGVQYDLHVTSVHPSTYNAVVCINTDIEVDFAPAPATGSDTSPATGPPQPPPPPVASTGGGRRLMDSEPHPASVLPPSSQVTIPKRKMLPLRPEPPTDQAEGVCVVQVRLEQASAKRRFDVREARVADLYDFAASALLSSDDGGFPRFRLVTRYPRRVIEPAPVGTDENRLLEEVGMKAGQELLIMERL